jgi:hypothetical protein
MLQRQYRSILGKRTLKQAANDLGLTAKDISKHYAPESSSCLHRPNRHSLKHENIHILHINCMQPTSRLNITQRSLRCSGMLRGIDGQLLTNSFKTKYWSHVPQSSSTDRQVAPKRR